MLLHQKRRDPIVWRDVADALVREAGVNVLYHTTVAEVLVEGGERVAGVVAYNKEGPLEARAKVTIDASGDADLMAMGGFGITVGDDGKVRNPTMIFRCPRVVNFPGALRHRRCSSHSRTFRQGK